MVTELCILHDGENDYKMPHTNKARLEREGRLPVYIQCSDQLLDALHNVATYKTKCHPKIPATNRYIYKGINILYTAFLKCIRYTRPRYFSKNN